LDVTRLPPSLDVPAISARINTAPVARARGPLAPLKRIAQRAIGGWARASILNQREVDTKLLDCLASLDAQLHPQRTRCQDEQQAHAAEMLAGVRRLRFELTDTRAVR
jgi:hypothetical protein